MRNQQMPDDRLEGFGVRRHRRLIDDRDQHANIGDFGSVAAVASDHAADGRADALRLLHGAHEIGADVLLKIAAAYRKDHHHIAGVQAAAAQPVSKRRLPAIVVNARRQLRDIIGRRVGFNAADFAKVVDRMRSVPGTAADSQNKQSPASVTQCRQPFNHARNCVEIDAAEDFCGFGNILTNVIHLAFQSFYGAAHFKANC